MTNSKMFIRVRLYMQVGPLLLYLKKKLQSSTERAHCDKPFKLNAFWIIVHIRSYACIHF